MDDFAKVVEAYGEEIVLAPGEVLFRQGSESDGLYYLREGRLGVYKEEDELHFLSEIAPGETVGELGAATGWRRTAMVKAETASRVVHVSDSDFDRALDESPSMAASVVCQIGERLTDADAARLALSRSGERAAERIEALCSETARLEELLRLREELADMIVHDLYNPLTVIGSGLQLLERVPIPEAHADYASSVVATMRRATLRMERLVNTLMDIARLEEGRMRLDRAPVALGALVEEVVEEERHLAESRGIELEQRPGAELPTVEADRQVLQRVLINLLDNALKFTPSGGRVWVEAERGSGPGLGDEVRLVVVDTGPGVPPEERERIFERFTQGQDRTGERRGSGLGLAFCRMAVEAHGGRIWVEPGPEGVGSRFVVGLPVV